MKRRRSEDRIFRRVPRQERSRALVEAVLLAGEQILDEEGGAALTVARLCERAGVSPGSLYEYFPSKEAVIRAILLRLADRAEARLAALVDGGAGREPVALLREAFEVLVAHHRSMLRLQPDFYRLYLREFLPLRRRRPEALPEEMGREAEAIVERLLGGAPPTHAALSGGQRAFLLSRGAAALLEVTIAERPDYLFDDRYVSALRRMLEDFLLGGARRDAPGEGGDQ